jgi:hypothetical protein
MERIRSGTDGQRNLLEQCLGEVRTLCTWVQQGERSQDCQPPCRSVWVASTRLVKDHL